MNECMKIQLKTKIWKRKKKKINNIKKNSTSINNRPNQKTESEIGIKEKKKMKDTKTTSKIEVNRSMN